MQAGQALQLLKKQDPIFEQLIRRFGQCQLNPSSRTPFEYLIRSIISQQLSAKAASTIVGRVEALLGRKHFSAKNIVALSPEQLRACGLSHAKVQYSHGIARAVLDKEIDFEQLKVMDSQEVIEQLVKLKGVGEWTAQMFCIFALGHLDIFAPADIGLQRGLQILYQLDEKPSKQQIEDMTSKWKPYRSVASWYLWRLVDDN